MKPPAGQISHKTAKEAGHFTETPALGRRGVMTEGEALGRSRGGRRTKIDLAVDGRRRHPGLLTLPDALTEGIVGNLI